MTVAANVIYSLLCLNVQQLQLLFCYNLANVNNINLHVFEAYVLCSEYVEIYQV